MLAQTFRTATLEDVDRLVEIHTAAFPDDRGHAERRRNFLQNPLGSLDDLHVVLHEGRIVGHAFLFTLGAYFGGPRLAVAGIASVGVAPEARRRGVASALLAHLHGVAQRRGALLTMLYAFRQTFYARHGYAPVSPQLRLVLDPRSIPAAWVAEATRAPLRAATGADRLSLEAVYAYAAERSTGWLERPRALWDSKLLSPRIHGVLLPRSGGLAGYVLLEHVQAELHAATRLLVHELVAEDAVARRTLLGCLGAQADQVHELELDVAEGDPLLFALRDPDGDRHGTERMEHALGTVGAGPMLRIVDVARALEARGYALGARVTLDVAGKLWDVDVRDGRPRVTPVAPAAAADMVADLGLDEATLASVAFGGLRVSQACALGLARATPARLAELDALFALPPFAVLDSF